MGLFKKIKKAAKRIGSGVKKAATSVKDRPLETVATFGLSAQLRGLKETLAPTPGSPDTPGVSEALSQASIAEAAAEADREERVRRARTALRGGTIKTGILGAPLAGVALTRPKLG